MRLTYIIEPPRGPQNPVNSMLNESDFPLIISTIEKELVPALTNWPAFDSAHEGYAVLLEEMDELWEHVKTNQKKRNLAAMRHEAIQVAAMAIRFAMDVCDERMGRK